MTAINGIRHLYAILTGDVWRAAYATWSFLLHLIVALPAHVIPIVTTHPYLALCAPVVLTGLAILTLCVRLNSQTR